MHKTPISFLPSGELGHALAKDNLGARKTALVERITREYDDARSLLDRGAAPEQAQALRSQLTAADAAKRIVDLIWGACRASHQQTIRNT